mmetsp:Transcript_19171/g.35790  ORF Transcript_19171/g.35790 Transcript_19171/m.35790 type:complete len:108 (+) Transcript_19171:1028-1351(+)
MHVVFVRTGRRRGIRTSSTRTRSRKEGEEEKENEDTTDTGAVVSVLVSEKEIQKQTKRAPINETHALTQPQGTQYHIGAIRGKILLAILKLEVEVGQSSINPVNPAV